MDVHVERGEEQRKRKKVSLDVQVEGGAELRDWGKKLSMDVQVEGGVELRDDKEKEREREGGRETER